MKYESHNYLKREIEDKVHDLHNFFLFSAKLLDRWVWASTRRPLTYTNWNAGKPNNYHGVYENCLEMLSVPHHIGQWNDESCDFGSHFICEMEHKRGLHLLSARLVGNSCYFFSTSHKIWADASSFCKAYNSHLAVVETKAENDFLADMITRISIGLNGVIGRRGTDPDFWIGGTDEVIDGVWVWAPITDIFSDFRTFGVTASLELNSFNASNIIVPPFIQNAPLDGLDSVTRVTFSVQVIGLGPRPRAYHAELAVVESKAENDFLAGMLNRIKAGFTKRADLDWDFWLGGNNEVTGHWVWTSKGTPITYTNWVPGQGHNTHVENCLEMVQWDNHVGQWNDDTCSDESHFICEMNLPGNGILG